MSREIGRMVVETIVPVESSNKRGRQQSGGKAQQHHGRRKRDCLNYANRNQMRRVMTLNRRSGRYESIGVRSVGILFIHTRQRGTIELPLHGPNDSSAHLRPNTVYARTNKTHVTSTYLL